MNTYKSIDIAKYYISKRKIPPDNLVEVWVTDKETCSRIDYQAKVATPVRKYLEQKGSGHPIRFTGRLRLSDSSFLKKQQWEDQCNETVFNQS